MASIVPSIIPATLVPAIIAAHHRRAIAAFEAAGADHSDRAKTAEELGLRARHLRHLVRSGVLVEVAPTRYYLAIEGLERWNQRKRRAATVIVVTVVVVMTVLLLVKALSSI